jgi:nitrogen fixation/metabolism regulation signal transduction histidine kinase
MHVRQSIEAMKAATAKALDSAELEDLGRATLQIVHDLKNQLNGIKLYATFLRKRLESQDRPLEEREILGKLIAGLDRAAMEMTTLVRYSRPIELRRQRANLSDIVLEAMPSSICESPGQLLYGDFDGLALGEAFRALTQCATHHVNARDRDQMVVRLVRSDSATSPEAMIEWNKCKFQHHAQAGSAPKDASVHTALATRIIEAHGGRLEFTADAIRAWLPLID